MNISATTTSLSSLSSLSAAPAVSPVGSTPDDSTTTAVDSSTSTDQTHLSRMGELFSKLQDLETSDPAQAKQVLTSIASALTDKANGAGNTDPHLQALADKFTQAADTGDLSALRPRGGGHRHRPEAPPPTASPDDATTTPSAATPSADATTAGAATKAASYAQFRTDRVDLESIISNALSGVAA